MHSIQQRDAFFNELYDIASADKNVYLVSTDMGAPSLDKFRIDLQNQYINVGIAEQNTISVASGLALEGKKVFAYGIASFISTRCLEQIRINCSLMKIPLTIVGIGAGFSYEDSGPTHHIFEDMTLIKALSNMIVNSCSDSVIAAHMAHESLKYGRANYVRLDRKIFPDIYDKNTNFDDGYNVLKSGTNYIVSTGIMVHSAIKIASQFDDLGVIDIHTFPYNDEKLSKILDGGNIITIEEHTLNGGFGSDVCAMLQDNKIRTSVLRIGINNMDGVCYKYGGRESVIWKYYGIDEETSTQRIGEFLEI